ncbi:MULTISPECIES: hypothetical protein [unclassified Modicisalibacter]|uniref:hypothetical protein n=1 Tax=unclassified Modicisalibacter TaxID=2679913 RepID=UPI001CCE280F|nr:MULTISPECIES: hypothetical protein [unclassified Modicisalibacter]MBZ9557141.1 hypothetical protein [Modicisalibacter sp. R2A 31.J]MBZ9574145.1 hypothetical protein [Modicisalibacter sp. MOD 31.J]
MTPQQDEASPHRSQAAHTPDGEIADVCHPDSEAARCLLAPHDGLTMTSYAAILRQMARSLTLTRRPERGRDNERLESWYNRLCRRIVGFGGIPPEMTQETLLAMADTPHEERQYAMLLETLNALFRAAGLDEIPRR